MHLVEWMAATFQWNVLAAEMKRERSIIILKFLFHCYGGPCWCWLHVLRASVGLPGSSNDAFTFQASCLYQNTVGNGFLIEIQKVVNLLNGNELQLPPILLGDSAFPHHAWLQKSFGNTTLSRKQSHFNYSLSRIRMVTECAFGQLKGRCWLF